MGMFISGSSTSTGSFGDGRIAGKLGIQTTTPRGPIDVKGSNGSQGFYLSDAGLKVYLPTDVAHSSGATVFDFQVANLRLGTSAQGPVSIYPRFNSMLQLGTQDDSNLLTLSGSTKISGSGESTGSFGRLVVGRGSTDSSYASSAGGNVVFGVNGGQSTDRIILQANTVEIGDTDYFGGNVFLKGSVGGFTSDPSLFIQKGLQIMGGGNNRGISINAGNADKKTFIVAQAGGMDLHDFYIANARAGRRIKMQVVSGSTLTDTLTLTTGSDSNVMVELGGNISGSAAGTGSFGNISVDGHVLIGDEYLKLNRKGAPTTNNIELFSGNSGGYPHLSVATAGKFRIKTDGSTSMTFLSSGGNVGIGNDAPSQKLTVQGIISGSGGLHSGGNIRLGPGGYFQGYHNNSYVYLRNYLRFHSSVDFFTSQNGNSYNFYNYSNTSTPQMKLTTGNPANSTSAVLTISGSIVTTGFGNITAAGNISGSSTSTASFGHGYIDSRLGIGTTSPVMDLDVVAQDAKIKIMSERHNTVTGTTNHFTTLGYDSSGARPFIISNQSNTPILFKNNAGSIPLAIHTNQYVGVNTTSPGYRLDVLHVGDDQFRVGRSSTKYVAIRDDVMQFTGMTGNGMRIQTSDNSDIKFSAGTGDIIFDYANSGGRVISYADIRVHGDIIAENYIVSSSVTHMTQSFSSGSTIFGDTPNDTHQFTGSLTVTGSSVIANSGQDPTAILSDPHSTSAYGLHVRGLNKGIRFDRYNSDGHVGAGTTMYQNGSDWTVIVQNNNDPIGDPDANTNLGVAVNRLGGAFYPQNNSIDFSGYDKSFTRLGKTQLTMDNDVTFTLPYNKNFIVSGSEIEFTPTEKVEITGNLDVDGDITGSAGLSIHDIIGTGKIVLTADALNDGLYVRRNNSTNALAHFSNRFGNGEVRDNLKLDNTNTGNGTGNRLMFSFSSAQYISITGRKEIDSYGSTAALIIKHHRSHVQPDGIGFARFSMLKVSEALGGATGYTGTGAAAAAPSFYVSTGSIYVETGNVSGSSTSTGSFGLSKIQSSTISSESDIMYFKPDGVTSRMSLSSQGPSVSNIYTPSIVAAGGNSLNIIASGTFLNIGADYDSTGGNIDIYPTGKNIGVAKTARFNPDATFFYKSLDITGHVTASGDISGSATSTGSFGKIDFAGTGNRTLIKYTHQNNANLNIGVTTNEAGSGGQFVIAGGSALANRIATFQHAGGQPRLGIGVTNPINSSLAISAPADNDIQLDVSTGGGGYYGLGMANSGQHRYLLGNTYSTTTTRFSITAGGLTTAHDRITIYNALGNGREHYVGINKGATNPAHSLDVSGSIVFANGTQAVQISGSAQSTGSFGSLVVAGRVQGDTTFNDDIIFPNGTDSKISFPGGGTHEIYREGYYIKYQANLGHAFVSSGNETFSGGQGTVYIRRSSTNHSIETTMSDFKYIAGSGTGGFGFRTVGSDYEYLAIKSFKTGADQGLIFQTRTHSTSTHTERLRIDTSGHLLPGADNTSNLGSASKRWANIHSADLHLSNEDTKGNEVDGTTGNWTIQEGEDDLFLLNRKNGKKYRFKLEEIT